MIWPFARPQRLILMVCTANVCRSPAAEASLRHHLRHLDLHKRVSVQSAGTDVGAPGRKPDPRVVAILKEMGMTARGIRAQPLTEKLLAGADDVFVMEEVHRDAVKARFPAAAARVRLLDPQGVDIADPYFGNKAGVRSAVEYIDQLTSELARELNDRQG